MITEYLFIAGAAFIASLISGLGGFGGGFIIVLALAPIVGAKAVVPLLSVYAICGNISRVYVYRKTIDWKLASQFILSSLPGVYIGATFLKTIPERGFLGFMGGILLMAIPARRYLKSHAFEPGLKTIITIGLVFGFVSGAAAGSGMLVIAGLTSVGLQGPLLLGTDAMIGLINASTRVLSFWSLDLLTESLVVMGVLMGIVTFPGTLVASKLVHAMGLSLHNRLIEILIIGGGTWFVFKAIFNI